MAATCGLRLSRSGLMALILSHTRLLPLWLETNEVAGVAHLGGIDVLEAAGDFHHPVDVGPALVREGGLAHVGLADIVGKVGDFADGQAQGPQAEELFGGNHRDAHFELQSRDDDGEVGVAAAFAVPVDGALHLQGAGAHGGQGVDHAGSGVVVGVDADGPSEVRFHFGGQFLYLPGQLPAVGIAKHDHVRAAVAGGFQGLDRVFGIGLVAVEEMLRVVDHLFRVSASGRRPIPGSCAGSLPGWCATLR